MTAEVLRCSLSGPFSWMPKRELRGENVRRLWFAPYGVAAMAAAGGWMIGALPPISGELWVESRITSNSAKPESSAENFETTGGLGAGAGGDGGGAGMTS